MTARRVAMLIVGVNAVVGFAFGVAYAPGLVIFALGALLVRIYVVRLRDAGDES